LAAASLTGRVLDGAEQPRGAAHVQVGVTETQRLQHRGEPAENLHHRLRRAPIERFVRRQHLQIAALLQRLVHGHAAIDAVAPRLVRDGVHRRPRRVLDGHSHRPTTQTRLHNVFHRNVKIGDVYVDDVVGHFNLSLKPVLKSFLLFFSIARN